MPTMNIDQVNAGAGQTTLVRPVPSMLPLLDVESLSGTGSAIWANADKGTAIVATSTSGLGVAASTTSSNAVQASATTAIGVDGESQSGIGVRGASGSNNGVLGISGTNDGIYGHSFGAGSGVWGRSEQAIGVYGSGPTIGVLGQGGAVGVQGTVASGTGVLGQTSATTSQQAAIVGVSTNRRAQAGLFQGNVLVIGAMHVTGAFSVSGSKSAAVPFPDGSSRLLYSLESPEAWFEDFGRGRLRGGRARIRIDRQFAGTVRLNKYHVFLTPEGNSRGLYIAGMTRSGFDVREVGGGTSAIAFSYRIVAKRRDIPGRRFEKAAMPSARALTGIETPAVPGKKRAPSRPQHAVPRAAVSARRHFERSRRRRR